MHTVKLGRLGTFCRFQDLKVLRRRCVHDKVQRHHRRIDLRLVMIRKRPEALVFGMKLSPRHDWIQGIYDLEELADEASEQISVVAIYGRGTWGQQYMSAWALVGSTAMTSAKPPL